MKMPAARERNFLETPSHRDNPLCNAKSLEKLRESEAPGELTTLPFGKSLTQSLQTTLQ